MLAGRTIRAGRATRPARSVGISGPTLARGVAKPDAAHRYRIRFTLRLETESEKKRNLGAEPSGSLAPFRAAPAAKPRLMRSGGGHARVGRTAAARNGGAFSTLASDSPAALFDFQRAAEPFPARFSEEFMAESLRRPIGVGPRRRAILDVLGMKHRRRLRDQWDYVRFAQERKMKLDFTAGPKRKLPADLRRPGFQTKEQPPALGRGLPVKQCDADGLTRHPSASPAG